MDSDTFGLNQGVFDDPSVAAAYVTERELMVDEQSLFDEFVRDGADVLDLGVGTGRTTPYLAQRAATYVGIDYAPAMIAAARRLNPTADFRIGDASDLSEFDSHSFDVVVFSYNGLDYLHPDERRGACLEEIHRVLRDDGIFIFARHNPRGLVERLPTLRPQIRRLATQTYVGARRGRRLIFTAAFWTGRGYVREPARGGLVHHMSTPSRTEGELEAHGFHVVKVLSAKDDRRRSVLMSPWLSYAAWVR